MKKSETNIVISGGHTDAIEGIIADVVSDFAKNNLVVSADTKASNPSAPIIALPLGVCATDLMNRKVESIPNLIEPIFRQVGLACLAGSSDAGKSAFLRQMALAVVNGDERFCGFEIKPRYRKAIYISSEDDEQAISYLLNKQNRERRYALENCGGLRYVFDTQDLLQRLDVSLTAEPVDLVILDAFGDLYGRSSLNDSNVVRSFLHEFDQLATKHQCLFVFLHHTGKRSNEREPDKANLLGSQGLEAKMRVVLELREDPGDASLRHLCILKGNYLPSEYKHESFILRFDEDMVFHNTGHRRPFSELVKTPGPKQEQADKYSRAKELQNQGMSYEQIGQAMGMNKGTVHNLLNKSRLSVVSNVAIQRQGKTRKTPRCKL